MRYDNHVVAVLTHQTALAGAQGQPAGDAPTSTVRAICCTCCPRAPSPTSAICRDVAVEPARRRRVHPPRRRRRRRLRQPQRVVGLPPDGAGRRAGGPQPRRGHPAADLRPVRGAGTGRARAGLAGRRVEHAAWRSTRAAPRCCCARCRWWCTATPSGAAVLIRDVTEVKRRDRALLSKDATIREIHHRVKNNLQTVAALLRLQARRTNNAEGREALIESVRRVSSIALVHDALSMSVDEEVNLDEVIDRILPIMNDVATRRHADPDQPGRRPRCARRRPGHRAGHGDHRAGAERDRARLRRRRPSRAA